MGLAGLRSLSGLSGLVGGGLPSVDFNPALLTFTPNMAVRAGTVFAGAPIVQGKYDGSGTPDVLTFPRGDLVANPTQFNYQHIDPYQGSLVFWITPEWDGDDAKYHYIFGGQAARFSCVKSVNDYLYIYVANASVLINVAAWTAGTTYLVIARWDSRNPFDGTNHMCLSINDIHTFGRGTPFDVITMNPDIHVGSSNTSTYGSDSIIEGLTLYRRVLYDGTYGNAFTFDDGGAVDEIAAIYAAGVGADPATVCGGAWDGTFCLPTDTDTATPLGDNPANHAWSSPAVDAVVEHGYVEDGGYLGGAYGVAFNGTNTYANLTSNAVFDDLQDNAFTVDMWVRIDEADEIQYLISKHDAGSTNGWRIFYHSGDRFYFDIICVTINATARVDGIASTLANGKWHLITVFFDDAGDRKPYIAFDGVWAASYFTQIAGVGAIVSDAAEPMTVGCLASATPTTSNLLGCVGHISIWSDDHHVHGTDFIPPRLPPGAGGALVESWTFADGTGAAAVATVTTPGNDAALTNYVWEEQWALEGTPVVPVSHTFDGAATFIDYGSGANLDNLPQTGITVEGYFRLDVGATQTLINKRAGVGAGWLLYKTAAEVHFVVYYDDTNASASAAFLSDGLCHHIAATYDETGDRIARLWVDGILVNASAASVGNYNADAAIDLLVGRNSYAATAYMNGAVGWHRVSDSVRYTANFVPPSRVNPPGNDINAHLLINMDEGAGVAVADTSGNAYNGTITPGTGEWLNTPDLSVDEPGAQIYNQGYNIGSDGVDDGIVEIDTGLTPGDDYVVRAVLSVGQSGVAQPSISIYDEIGAAEIVELQGPKFTGLHTGAINSATLIDAGARWPQMIVGWSLYNVTDGSSTVVTAVSGDMTTITGVLAGGTDDDWDTNDVYKLMPPNGIFSDFPWVETFCVELPAACTSVSWKVINPAGDGIITVHQFEVQPSLITNGGMETGAGNPWIPTDWANSNLDAGDSAAASVAGEIHSGVDAIQFNAGAVAEGITSTAYVAAAATFISCGIWFYTISGDWDWRGAAGQQIRQDSTVDRTLEPGGVTAGWKELSGIFRSQGAGAKISTVYQTNAGTRYIDDAYAVLLNAVTLTVTPATEANSLESGGIRIDGLDACSQPVPEGYFTATEGWFRWRMRPRHSDGVLESFGVVNPFIARAYFNGTNYISVYINLDNSIRLHVAVGGVGTIVAWSPTNLVADTEQMLKVRYADGVATLIVDGVIEATATPGAGIDFGVNFPNIIYWGNEQNGLLQAGVVFIAP